jgi:hypothetical protein
MAVRPPGWFRSATEDSAASDSAVPVAAPQRGAVTSIAPENAAVTTIPRDAVHPQAEAEHVVSEGARESAESSLCATVQLWAARDFSAAYKWARQVEDVSLRPLLIASVFDQMGREAPQSTLELAQEAPLGELRERVLQNLAVHWSETDPAAASAWAMTQPATPSRDGIFRELALARLPVDPNEAAHLILFAISPGPVQDEAVSLALERWSAADLAHAEKWVGQFPSGALRQKAEATLSGRVAGSQ